MRKVKSPLIPLALIGSIRSKKSISGSPQLNDADGGRFPAFFLTASPFSGMFLHHSRKEARVSLFIQTDVFSADGQTRQIRKIRAWLPEGNHRKSYQMDFARMRKAAGNQRTEVPAKRNMTRFRLYRFAFIVTVRNESHESIRRFSVFVYQITQLFLIFQKNNCFDLQ